MNNALYLPNWTVTKIDEKLGHYEIEASFDIDADACAHCGVVGEYYRHGTHLTPFRDAPVRGKTVRILVNRRRYRCRACGQTFAQPLPDMEADRQMTRRLREHVEVQGFIEPFTKVARLTGLHEKTVRQIVGARIEVLNTQHRPVAPRVLGIDELTLLRKRRCIFVDIEGRRALDILEAMTKPGVVHWLSHLPGRDRIEVVTMDMWRPYATAVRAILPKAAIVVDKWHVLRMANDAVDRVRKDQGAAGGDSVAKSYRRSARLLLKRPANMDARQAMTLDGWLRNEPLIKAAWDMKEAFYAVYDAPSSAEAATALDAWQASQEHAPAAVTAAFAELARACRNWRTEILAYFDHRLTNAFTETKNGLIKQVNRAGRGYTFPVIRARALFDPHAPAKEDAMKCDMCLGTFAPSQIEVAHITPIGRGGATDASNRMHVCATCHRFHTESWFARNHVSTLKSE